MDKTKVIATLEEKGRFESAQRIYDTDAISPALNTCSGGGLEPKILVPKLVGGVGEMKSNNNTQYYQQNRIYDAEEIALCQSTSENFNPWYAVASRKRGEEHHIEISDREEANSITTINTDSMVGDLSNVRIRKLTPKECWRLMGFFDEDFEKAKKVNSDSQLYKQAGNSIIVNCLEAIFKEML